MGSHRNDQEADRWHRQRLRQGRNEGKEGPCRRCCARLSRCRRRRHPSRWWYRRPSCPQSHRQAGPCRRREDRCPDRLPCSDCSDQADCSECRPGRLSRRSERRSLKEAAYGYNALTDEYGDLIKMGVIVPTKVERAALQNAASISGLLLTTDAVVSEIKEKKNDGG